MARTRCALLLAIGIVLASVSVAAAEPTVQVLEDWGQASATIWLTPDVEGQPQVKPGKALSGLTETASTMVFDQFGTPDEINSTARIVALEGSRSMGFYATVEPAGLRDRGRGQSRVEFSWRIQTGEEVVDYSVNLWANGGSSYVYLYDETSAEVVSSTALDLNFGTSVRGQLLPGHMYRLQGYAQANVLVGGSSSAGLEFGTNGRIVAVP